MNLPYPISANKYWRNVKGRMVRSAEAKVYKDTVGWLAKSIGIKRLHGGVHLSVKYHPKLKLNGQASEIRLDLDNVLKVTADALNGIAYDDDKQIIKITAELSYGIKDGGLTVNVTEAFM
jgi:crossover junction endodeoxyribonuclease RusA